MENKEIINNIKTSSIIPYERNARKNDNAVKEVVKSIERTGYRTPIIIDENNVILCGHTRLKAIQKLGWKEIPFVVQYKDLTEEQKQEYRIRDNKTGEIAEWDFEILEADFTSDQLIDFGFDIKDLTQPEVIEDEAPPPPEIARTVKGDIYTLGNHRVMCGDSTMIDDVERLMDGKKANMMFTDPPYLMDFKGNVHADGSKSFNAKHGQIKNDKMSKDQGIEFIDSIIKSAYSFVNGAFYICFYRLGIHYIINALHNNSLDYKAIIIWDKGNHTLSNSDYMSKYEPIIYGWFGEHKFYGDRSNFDIWSIKRTSKNELHPTMKPIELCSKAVGNSSEHNGIVLDLFIGSGSTLIACEQTNRICYGMELDEKYCDVVIQRWVNFTGITKILLNGQEIEWPVDKKI